MKYVAFLDILGFKDLIDNNPIDSVLKIYKDSFEKSYSLVFTDYANYDELKADDVVIK